MLDHVSTRRVFLQRGLTILAAAPTVPAFLDQTVLAMADPLDAPLTQRPGGKDGKILVVLQLAGGNDGLSMVVPYADDDYHKARPGLRHEPKSVLKLDDYVGLNPNLKPLADFFHDGRLAVVQGVGYPNPNRSHFRSTDIWQTAEPERVDVASGWVGRYFDNTCQGADPHFGVSIGPNLPLAMQGEKYTPVSFERPETYQFNSPDPALHRKLNAIDSKGATPSGSSELDFLQRTALDVQLSSDQILSATRKYKAKGNYPNDDFGNGLRTVAAMIGGGLSTRVYYVSLSGFDTHVVQRGKHDALMSQLAQGVAAFWADLKHQGNADRVLMMTFSEFGRRVAQNDSGGTDHGAAAPMLLIGPTVASGLLGKHPSLKPKDLDEGDLRFNTDFRSVYAAILEGWLDTPSAKVLGKAFAPLKVFRA